jgi:putative serine/threonine protein kinase
LAKVTEVPVQKLLGTRYSRFLTFPIRDELQARARVEELSAAGITSIRFIGSTLIDGLPILGKGCVGIVTQAQLDGMPVALKIRRNDGDRLSMMNEARLLRLANSIDVGPRLVVATRDFLAMQLFKGLPLYKWAQKKPVRRELVKQVLSDLLHSCFRLDAIGLDHGELSHAPKNVLVSATGVPCIVDFESASTTRHVANVTSLVQYFLFGQLSWKINASRLFPKKKHVLSVLADYKRESSVENFRAVLSALGLAR